MPEPSGDDFVHALFDRVREARKALRQAADSTDTYAVGEALDELEHALLLARKHGIHAPDEGDGGEQVRS